MTTSTSPRIKATVICRRAGRSKDVSSMVGRDGRGSDGGREGAGGRVELGSFSVIRGNAHYFSACQGQALLFEAQMNSMNATGSLDRAFRRTKRLLLPFDLGKWVAFGVM